MKAPCSARELPFLLPKELTMNAPKALRESSLVAAAEDLVEETLVQLNLASENLLIYRPLAST